MSLSTASPFTTPILLLVFNRPETTTRVLERIRDMRPSSLFVAADGPRPELKGEEFRCAEARRVATQVDWDCEVHTLFRERNLGCGAAVSGGITWFMREAGEGIVLEDDCVPSLSFFRYCRELLDHYREESRVMHISGSSFQYGRRRGRASYYFSKYPNVWGWATWQRAWESYDFSLRPTWVLADTWDTQWQLSLEKEGGLSIVPNKNLVQNIGFGGNATHTMGDERPASLEAHELQFPLVHPTVLKADRLADAFTYYVHHRQIRHMRLIWMYQLWDFIYARLKWLKRKAVGSPASTRPA